MGVGRGGPLSFWSKGVVTLLEDAAHLVFAAHRPGRSAGDGGRGSARTGARRPPERRGCVVIVRTRPARQDGGPGGPGPADGADHGDEEPGGLQVARSRRATGARQGPGEGVCCYQSPRGHGRQPVGFVSLSGGWRLVLGRGRRNGASRNGQVTCSSQTRRLRPASNARSAACWPIAPPPRHGGVRAPRAFVQKFAGGHRHLHGARLAVQQGCRTWLWARARPDGSGRGPRARSQSAVRRCKPRLRYSVTRRSAQS